MVKKLFLGLLVALVCVSSHVLCWDPNEQQVTMLLLPFSPQAGGEEAHDGQDQIPLRFFLAQITSVHQQAVSNFMSEDSQFSLLLRFTTPQGTTVGSTCPITSAFLDPHSTLTPEQALALCQVWGDVIRTRRA